MHLAVHDRAFADFHMNAVIALEKVAIVIVTIAMIPQFCFGSDRSDDMETSLYDAHSRFWFAALL